MKNKNVIAFKIVVCIGVVSLAFLFLSDCKIDIKQLPQPRDFSAINLAKSKETSYIGKFDVISAESYNLSGAWKYTFKTILKQNRVFYEVLDLNEAISFKNGSYVLDVEVTPKYSDDYNYWWTWPSIYPFVGLWPAQVRTGEYEVRIDYTLLKADQVVKTGSILEKDSLTLYVYGMYRTTDFEEMIETANLKAISRCVKEISSNL
ncbi:LBF_2127 family putative lipoprotein [Leptospira yasudae]|uniref:Lipoprotein n=1 Tax=Leptospira yasudae TaxID=2202201 RepID=A0A6N4QZK8_9LEPT|nr:hypothetical protein [Leptospira yasudae]TGL79132.1 hypothetical protein EHQ72_09170 [Leptospira yasudae]TGL83120.1 hypothetical protein EHQ77_02385 [Leptospira yasudae]TGL85649.1 hypothetical protein EHQ83_07300 [Leptospira yasudae]